MANKKLIGIHLKVECAIQHIEEVEILISKSGDTGVSPSSFPSLSSSASMMLDTKLMSTPFKSFKRIVTEVVTRAKPKFIIWCSDNWTYYQGGSRTRTHCVSPVNRKYTSLLVLSYK